MEQKSLLIRFTGKKELELYEWFRRECFETVLAMAEICRRGLVIYNSKVGSKVEEK